jgi:hypothetical protein
MRFYVAIICVIDVLMISISSAQESQHFASSSRMIILRVDFSLKISIYHTYVLSNAIAMVLILLLSGEQFLIFFTQSLVHSLSNIFHFATQIFISSNFSPKTYRYCT